MSWAGYRLDDTVEIQPTYLDAPIFCQGMFVVHAESRRAADITARVHLCMMIQMSGIMHEPMRQLERGEDDGDLA